MNIKEKTDRVAWTQYIEQGRGRGLNAYRHRQPEGSHRELKRNHYFNTRLKA